MHHFRVLLAAPRLAWIVYFRMDVYNYVDGYGGVICLVGGSSVVDYGELMRFRLQGSWWLKMGVWLLHSKLGVR